MKAIMWRMSNFLNEFEFKNYLTIFLENNLFVAYREIKKKRLIEGFRPTVSDNPKMMEYHDYERNVHGYLTGKIGATTYIIDEVTHEGLAKAGHHITLYKGKLFCGYGSQNYPLHWFTKKEFEEFNNDKGIRIRGHAN